MAERLATAYVKTHIRLTEAEMIEFIRLFREHGIHLHVRVFDNGNYEVVLENDGHGPDVTLNFEYRLDAYVFEDSCCFYSSGPANAMRKAISTFKGTAITERRYAGFTMEYRYDRGVVVSIVERRPDGSERVVYQYRNTVKELESLFQRQDIEDRIARVREEINEVLDQRRVADRSRVAELDSRLAALSRRLFALEA